MLLTNREPEPASAELRDHQQRQEALRKASYRLWVQSSCTQGICNALICSECTGVPEPGHAVTPGTRASTTHSSTNGSMVGLFS